MAEYVNPSRLQHFIQYIDGFVRIDNGKYCFDLYFDGIFKHHRNDKKTTIPKYFYQNNYAIRLCCCCGNMIREYFDVCVAWLYFKCQIGGIPIKWESTMKS